MIRRRILSIDGGGIKGVLPAAFLASLEESLPCPIHEYFDLIVGTSTGGILALGLGLGFRASELLAFYEELGPKVFGRSRLVKWARWAGSEQYSPEPLRAALTAKFGDRRLGHSKVRLVIPSFNLDSGEVYVHKTSHHVRFEKDYKTLAVDVAMQTAAAPTYFPPSRSASGIPLVDGGMWANNPAGFAAVEAISVLGWPSDGMSMLSLGCSAAALNTKLPRWLGTGGLFWARRIVDVFMVAQSSSSVGTAQLLLGHANVHRYNPQVAPGRFALDGIDEIAALKGLGHAEARKALSTLRPIFFDGKAGRFDPHHVLESAKAMMAGEDHS